MNGGILIVPLLLIRYALPTLYNSQSLLRAAHYPSFPKSKKVFLSIYQLSTCLLLLIPFFLKVNLNAVVGICIYLIGNSILTISTIHFSKPNNQNMNSNGLYKVSRNPMYISYFIYFLGCSLITKSMVLFIVVMIFQISCHWLIIEEENWCIKTFGDSYREYIKKVRRYI